MPRYSDEYCEVNGVPTLCKCPGREKMHTMRVNFVGRGLLRKFCPMCNIVAGHRSSGMDGSTELNKHALQRSGRG